MEFQEHMKRPVYVAQCKTWTIAASLAKSNPSVLVSSDILSACERPPFCLRIVRKYRTPAMTEFRNQVAAKVRASRKKKPDFFTSSTDGALYDTSRANWANLPPLRPIFSRHFREILHGQHLRASLRAGAYAWPGGYQLAFYQADGETVCFKCVKAELKRHIESIRFDYHDRAQGVFNTEETDSAICCADCGEPLNQAATDEADK